MRSFTYSWQQREMLRHKEGEPIGLAYGSQFSRRGIGLLDQVYIVSVHRGRVYLLGKMLVGAVTYCPGLYLRWVGRGSLKRHWSTGLRTRRGRPD